MKKMKWLVCVLFVVLMTSVQAVSARAEVPTQGLAFDFGKELDMEDGNFTLPLTLEATIYLPRAEEMRAGAILGNYNGAKETSLNFEILAEGVPSLSIYDNSDAKVKYGVKFDEVHINNDQLTHLAITLDAATDTWSCYVDGELAQTVEKEVPDSFEFDTGLRIGGNLVEKNERYFKGIIQKIVLYSDVRTAAEIASDYEGTLDESDILCAYDFTSYGHYDTPEAITCEAGVGPDLIMKYKFFKDAPALEDYAYSFSILGDIQNLTNRFPDKLSALYDWVSENAAATNMKLCMGLGDITDTNTLVEYERAKKEFEKLNGVVPYTFVRGNHDIFFTYSEQFPYEDYKQYTTGSFDNTTMLNTYYKFSVGEVEYLIVNIDFMFEKEVFDWANDVIAAHPTHHVIVTTHMYLNENGELDGGKYTREGGVQDFWDSVVSQHENIVMVISGHIPVDGILYQTRTGVNGNEIAEFLIDPQDLDINHEGLGLVAMFYFSEDGKDVQIRYYSTAYEAYWMPENQFSITLDIPEGNNNSQGVGEMGEKGPWSILFYIVPAVVVIAVAGGVVWHNKAKRRNSIGL